MPKVPPDKIQTTIYLPKSVHTELRIKALREHVSMTKLIIRAISRELNIGRTSRKRR
jgi:predicted HicB family RNase H-like nuclease